MIHSRISSKSQTTVPRAVRTALDLREGDTLAYRIEGDQVVLTRAPRIHPLDDPFSTFTEWADEADEAYDVLGRR